MIVPDLVASSPFSGFENLARNADGELGTPNPRGGERFSSSKIHDSHLDRLAIVYVRQSTMAQVVEHRESAEMQYKLAYRAAALGWPRHRVMVIDDDQGQSGSSAEHRLGFQRLMAEVSLRHVGIVLGIEMSRFARSNKDWHHLLELCGIFETLLADQDGVYDPADYNDRLLLGLKGTMSEAELHILRNRLQHGKRNKAERGELYAHLPRGFVKSASGKVMLDPDEQVQSVIRLFFEEFEVLGSGRKLLRWLLAHDIRLPLRPARGPHLGELTWTRPSHGAVHKLLHHPIYAGAYSYGRCRIDRRAKVPGRAGSGRVQLPMEQWQVLKQDHLPSYITWEQYLSNLKCLAQNAFRSATRGATRDGQALLGGVIRCGRCGRRMSVAYNDHRNEGRYVCHFAEPGSHCQSIQTREVDRLVEQQVLAALQPCALELSLKAANEIEAHRSHLDVQWQQRLERATYETQRARRQFNAVEPENRLVARELEKCWEQALRDQQNAEEEYARFRQQVPTVLDAADRADIQALASSVPALWNAETTRNEQRKAILRQLLDDVTVEVLNNSEVVDVRVTWVGGFASHYQMHRSVQRYDQLHDYDRLRERLRELRREGRSASHIAKRLNEEGFRTARGMMFQDITVQTLLFRSDMTRDKDQLTKESRFPDHDRWSIPELVRKLNIPTTTLCHWCRRGWVHVAKTRSNRWIIWADAAELKRLGTLSTYRRPQNRGPYPSELTTPGPLGDTGEQAHHET
jgi:DNA invertase Pin-like site-specific DNA recombinase